MANICENTLKVYSEDKKNIEYIKDFFKEDDVAIVDDYNLDIYFDSKWDFPEKRMNRLYQDLPNKNDIDMACLSVEWGNFYCTFTVCDSDGWHSMDY